MPHRQNKKKHIEAKRNTVRITSDANTKKLITFPTAGATWGGVSWWSCEDGTITITITAA